MRANILLIILLVVVVGILAVIIWTPGKSSEKTASVLNISVASGEVEYSSKDGKEKETVGSGGSLHIKPGQTPIRTSPPSITSKPEPTESLLTEKPLACASLSLKIKDTEGLPFVPAEVAVESGTARHAIQPSDAGEGLVESLCPGPCEITLSDPRILAGGTKRSDLRAGENEIQITVARKAIFFARIQNSRSEPISHADIILQPTNEFQNIPAADLNNRFSDEKGLAKYDPIVPGEYLLRVRAEGYLSHEESIQAQPDRKPQTIVLSTRSAIHVSVVDERQKPVFAARVSLRSLPGTGSIVLLKETSAPAGTVVFEDVPPGKYQLNAEHAWYESGDQTAKELQVEKDRHDVNLVLANRAYSISGRVYDKKSGQGIAGMEVVAFSEEAYSTLGRYEEPYDPYTKDYQIQLEGKTVTNENGDYILNLSKGGVYALEVSPRKDFVYNESKHELKKCEVPFSEQDTIVMLQEESNITGIDFALLRNWAISGHVLTHDGKPLEKAWINFSVLTSRGGSSNATLQYGFREYTETDADGFYRFAGNGNVFEEGTKMYANARHPKYGNYAKGFGEGEQGVKVVPIPGEEVTGVDVIFGERTLVSGTVTNSDGTYPANARFQVSHSDLICILNFFDYRCTDFVCSGFQRKFVGSIFLNERTFAGCLTGLYKTHRSIGRICSVAVCDCSADEG
ncbi:MAG: carboxypeptidase-like regulatory domain-containing protein, partial [bacterium]